MDTQTPAGREIRAFGSETAPPTRKRERVRKMTLSAMLLACAVALSVLENLLPALPGVPPGVKPGLSNIPVMYALLFTGKSDAFSVALLKSLFAALTRGPVAGFISLCGGTASLCVMLLLTLIFRENISVFLLSVLGALAHNIGQVAGVRLLYRTALWIQLPLMLPLGAATGALTALLLKFMTPVFQRAGCYIKTAKAENSTKKGSR